MNPQRSFAPSWASTLHDAGAELGSLLSNLASLFHFGASEDKLGTYLNAATTDLPGKAKAALSCVPQGPRYVLAVRGYLRHIDAIGSRWAWTDAEAKAFKATPEFAEATKAVAEAKRVFAALNPGYSLNTANLIRSLDTQIKLWNGNDSVLKAGQRLLSQCVAELARREYSERPGAASSARFVAFLKKHDVSPVPTVATPGLSGHGQLHAVDFIILQGDKVIASAKAASIKKDWDDAGWTDKLKKALIQASPQFDGPLPNPYEPWHYVFVRSK